MGKEVSTDTLEESASLKNTIGLPVIESAGGLVCNRYHQSPEHPLSEKNSLVSDAV